MKYLITTDRDLSPEAVAHIRDRFDEWIATPGKPFGMLMSGLLLHDLETGRTYGTPQVPPAPHVTIQMTWPAIALGVVMGLLIALVILAVF